LPLHLPSPLTSAAAKTFGHDLLFATLETILARLASWRDTELHCRLSDALNPRIFFHCGSVANTTVCIFTVPPCNGLQATTSVVL
jgi:hypothetical protein